MVIVDLSAQAQWEVAVVAVVGIVGDAGDVLGPHALQNPVCHCRLARSGATGHSYHDWLHTFLSHPTMPGE